MKALNSDKTFTPPSLPLPIVTAAYRMPSGNISNSVHKVVSTPYKDLDLSSAATRLGKNESAQNDVTPRIRPLYSLDRDTQMISAPLPETKVQNDSLIYQNKLYNSKLATTTLKSESGSSTFKPSSEGLANNTNNVGLMSFMKSLLSDKAFESISLLSISFFISGGLLMFYLINLL